MSGGGSGGEKTEKATPKRVKKARRDGQIGNTPEVGTWLGMLAASFVLPHLATAVMQMGRTALVRAAAVIREPDVGQAMSAASDTAMAAIKAVVPLAVLIALISVASVAAQGGLWFTPKLLKPKFNRLNPLSGLKRMFGPHGWWALVKALLKTTALGVVVYLSVRRLVPTVMGSGSLQLSTLVHICTSTSLNVLRYASGAGLLMAMADFAVVRRRNNKSLKMTKQEIKEEFKSTEGDPHVRGARRSRQLAMARNRMMADVPSADVVIVNPTHVAVALRYDPARGAPRVVAKGADHVAARIRELAERSRVPMVSDVPLARTLYKACDVGQEIPADLYRAVATVLAFVMTLKRRGSAAGTHTVRTLVPSR
jgi:flagellar biosynthetic protein FlhB